MIDPNKPHSEALRCSEIEPQKVIVLITFGADGKPVDPSKLNSITVVSIDVDANELVGRPGSYGVGNAVTYSFAELGIPKYVREGEQGEWIKARCVLREAIAINFMRFYADEPVANSRGGSSYGRSNLIGLSV